MSKKLTSSLDIKTINRNRIFKLIYEHPMICRPEIAHQLGVSLPTVMHNVKSLQEDGLVKEVGLLESTGGRKAVALCCVDNARTAIGLDITRSDISAVLVNLDGSIAKSIHKKIPFQNNSEYKKVISTTVDDLIEQSGVKHSSILGVGIAVPGILSADGKTLIHSYVLQIENLLCGDIGKYIPYKSVFYNDANAAGFAEIWNSHNQDNLIYISLSNSVGGSILFNNKIFKGNNQRSGEFGHITIERGGQWCYCGQKGCFDTYCSASVLSNLTNGSLVKFFEFLEAGDSRITIAWNNYLDYLATAVNNLRMTFDCGIIIGGYVGAYIENYLEELQSRVAKLNTFEEDGSYVKACKYRTEASAVGAALMHIKPFIDRV